MVNWSVIAAVVIPFVVVVAAAAAVVEIAAEMSRRAHAHSGPTLAGKLVSIFSLICVNYSLVVALSASSFFDSGQSLRERFNGQKWAL